MANNELKFVRDAAVDDEQIFKIVGGLFPAELELTTAWGHQNTDDEQQYWGELTIRGKNNAIFITDVVDLTNDGEEFGILSYYATEEGIMNKALVVYNQFCKFFAITCPNVKSAE